MKIDRILPGYAAIDIGQEAIFIACHGNEGAKEFGTFSADFEAAAIYLREHGITQVAMEATGVYWIPLHDLLEQRGFRVTMFNGATARNMPGRKSDVADCQWHAMLHSFGLLGPGYVPPEEIRQLRCIYRLREDHIGLGAMHIQHMQKALDFMNVRLHVVISQLHGVSGLRVIRAILGGERRPEALCELCDRQILKAKRAEVLKSLQGTWQDHHLFALRLALEGYEFCQAQAAACDRKIQQLLEKINQGQPPIEPPPGAKRARHNAPQIENLHSHLLTMTQGRDATVLPGITPLGFMKLLGETGRDLARHWPTDKHFSSWLGLAPNKHQSGRRQKRVPRKKTVAGQIFREAVLSLTKSKYLALGAAYRRLKQRKGAPIAITAIARKLATLYYNLMTKGLHYVEEGLEAYEAKYHQYRLKGLQRAARDLGLTLVPATAKPAVL
jgi:transposase